MEIIKLPNGKYEVKQDIAGTKQKTQIDKSTLEQAIKVLKYEIAEQKSLLKYKENLLDEMNKINKK